MYPKDFPPGAWIGCTGWTVYIARDFGSSNLLVVPYGWRLPKPEGSVNTKDSSHRVPIHRAGEGRGNDGGFLFVFYPGSTLS